MILTDESLMPFGKYRNVKMVDVPASYLHWFYHNCPPVNAAGQSVMDYIELHMSALKMEDEDKIWRKH